MVEQNLRRKFNLRTGREECRVEPMKEGQVQPRRCQICQKLGHEARDCRTLKREWA